MPETDKRENKHKLSDQLSNAESSGIRKNSRISVSVYDANSYEEKRISSIDEFSGPAPNKITWININGVTKEEIEKIGRVFNLHPLLIEDIIHSHQRAKLEDYSGHLFLVLKNINYDKENRLTLGQISIILSDNMVLSVNESQDNDFQTIADNLAADKGTIRKKGADYLLYSLIDVTVDKYFLAVEKIETKIENIETELLDAPDKRTLHIINKIKRDLVSLHRWIWPLREIVNSLAKNTPDFIKEETAVYIRDVHDHVVHISDRINYSRDMLLGMFDIYLSNSSRKMNEIMKVLTIISTIFIPLTFISGIYGMNFRNMPELDWPYSYPIVMGIMIIITAGMLFFFKRKKWI